MAAKPVDPDKLASLAELAREFGYHETYLARLASEKRIKAWRIGRTWASTKDLIQAYVDSEKRKKSVGHRPRGGTKPPKK